MTTSKNFKIIFTSDCKKEMEHIYNYISKNLYAHNSAKQLMKKVEETINRLKIMPEAYPIIKKYNELRMKYRRIVIGKYVIIYTILKKEIYIVHMYYGRSNYLNKI